MQILHIKPSQLLQDATKKDTDKKKEGGKMIKVIEYDEIILESSTFFHKAEDLKRIRNRIISELETEGIAILPCGITAKFARQYKCVEVGDTK